MAFILPFVFSVWATLLNNFVIEKAAFTGAEIGLLQSIREIPGFLAFTAIYILAFIKEQRFAIYSIGVLSIGVAFTGYFPTEYGLYATTFIMSVGFHYYETTQQSLTLQWVDKKESAHFLGKALAMKSFASLLAFGGIWLLMEWMSVSYKTTYLLAGGIGLAVAVLLFFNFPMYEQPHVQTKKIVLKKNYALYYVLTFLSGARRQIFMVFAGFMMVEKFGYSVGEISLLFGINYIFNLLFAGKIGQWVGKIGERKALTFEYVGLIFVFVGYALVETAEIAAALYVIDHMFFALAIAIKTYFQKIADQKDIAATASVSFTINHIAAVIIPVLLGMVWLYSSTLVFMIGAGFAICSLVASQLIPLVPTESQPFRFSKKAHTDY
ncbi:MFS transporter [Psychrosphaera sp.]|nr:MFS transporter [Psychrosphaera sp.]